MAEIYQDADADPAMIRDRRIAVIGYGNQGRAQALNLRDSGCTVRVGSRPGSPTGAEAEADGFLVQSLTEAAAWADVIALLLPDQYHHDVFDRSIRPVMSTGKLLLVAHGLSVYYGQVLPASDVDVAMVAPVSPGNIMRRLFLRGSGVPALVAVWQDISGTASARTLAYARALGCTRIGVQRTTFAEETETDLFGEQAVLCGGVPALIEAGYDTLVEAGYQAELAYYECIQQLKLIVDLIYEEGVAGMRGSISDTARYGSFLAGPRIVDDHVRRAMRGVLADIQSGAFARRWIAEAAAGAPDLAVWQEAGRSSPVEAVGRRIRALMAGVDDGAGSVESGPAVLEANDQIVD